MSTRDHDLRLTSFWSSYRAGVEVGVDSRDSASLLGIRDGFGRYFGEAVGQDVSISVKALGDVTGRSRIPLSDEEMLEIVIEDVSRLRSGLGSAYSFCAATVSGLQSVTTTDAPEGRFFVRTWVALEGPVGLSLGSSGALQLPGALFAAGGGGELPFAVPGKRRRGGMQSSLTAGLESRRSATAEATLHSLATMFYGVLEARRPG